MNSNIDKMINKLNDESKRVLLPILKYNRSKLKFEEKFTNNGFKLQNKKESINVIINSKKIIIETTLKVDENNIQNISKKIKVSDSKIEFPISKMITNEMITNIMIAISN